MEVLSDAHQSHQTPVDDLLVVGGFAPTLAGTLTKTGHPDAFFILTFIGALFLFAGYLVSIDVFAILRVPFTDYVLLDRRTPPPPAAKKAVRIRANSTH